MSTFSRYAPARATPFVGYIPYLSIELHIPDRPRDIAQDRVWNKIVKDAMRKALEKHHKKRIPLHFKQDARHRYRYKPRTDAYRAAKRRKYGSTRDLVKTGASERRMKSEGQITIGGTAAAKSLRGRLRMKFAFTQTAEFKASQRKRFIRTDRGWYDNAKTRGGVTIADMKREVQAFTQEERRQFAADFSNFMWDGYRAHKATRRRVRPGRTKSTGPLGGDSLFFPSRWSG